jgi:hypothetical protein
MQEKDDLFRTVARQRLKARTVHNLDQREFLFLEADQNATALALT